MFGSGLGTNGAGGPGILQMLGSVAFAIPKLPLVTGVLGGCIETLGTVIPLLTRAAPRVSPPPGGRSPSSPTRVNAGPAHNPEPTPARPSYTAAGPTQRR